MHPPNAVAMVSAVAIGRLRADQSKSGSTGVGTSALAAGIGVPSLPVPARMGHLRPVCGFCICDIFKLSVWPVAGCSPCRPFSFEKRPGSTSAGLDYAAVAVVVSGWRPRGGNERTHRASSPVSITVDFPDLRAVNSLRRIASKIRVRENPVLAAASSGVRERRGMARPAVLSRSESILHLCVLRYRAARIGTKQLASFRKLDAPTCRLARRLADLPVDISRGERRFCVL